MVSRQGETEARRIEEAIDRLLAETRTWKEADLYYSPSPDDWTAMQALAHLVEIQPYWAREVQRVVAEPGKPFGRTHEDPDRIAWVERHGSDQLQEVLPRIEASRNEATKVLRSLAEDDWEKIGVHSRRGEMTVEQIVSFFLVSHVEEHVDQAIRAIQAARG